MDQPCAFAPAINSETSPGLVSWTNQDADRISSANKHPNDFSSHTIQEHLQHYFFWTGKLSQPELSTAGSKGRSTNLSTFRNELLGTFVLREESEDPTSLRSCKISSDLYEYITTTVC